MVHVTSPATRVELPSALTEGRGVVLLPDADQSALMPVMEVLVQEGIGTLALPSPSAEQSTAATKKALDAAGLAALSGMYSFRASIGMHGVHTLDDAHAAIAGGATLAFCRFPERGVIEELQAGGVPAIVSALTPTEVNQAWLSNVAAVHVEPSEVFGTGYAQSLSELVPEALLIAMAQTPAAAQAWLRAGAVAVSMSRALLSRVFLSQDYSALRQRVAEMVSAIGSS